MRQVFENLISYGETLLLGEGNLSFSVSLVENEIVKPHKITVTTYEGFDEISEETDVNVRKLRSKGVKVLHSIDARKIDSYFSTNRFHNIVFQFPHSGKAEDFSGESPGCSLIRDFLTSSYSLLPTSGNVILTIVDNPFYNSVFKIEEAFKLSGFRELEKYSFDPFDFPGYNHCMTNSDKNALSNHNEFVTWVCKK